jgi:hypothetical protein
VKLSSVITISVVGVRGPLPGDNDGKDQLMRISPEPRPCSGNQKSIVKLFYIPLLRLDRWRGGASRYMRDRAHRANHNP